MDALHKHATDVCNPKSRYSEYASAIIILDGNGKLRGGNSRGCMLGPGRYTPKHSFHRLSRW